MVQVNGLYIQIRILTQLCADKTGTVQINAFLLLYLEMVTDALQLRGMLKLGASTLKCASFSCSKYRTDWQVNVMYNLGCGGREWRQQQHTPSASL